MWNQIRSLFSSGSKADDALFRDFDDVKSEVEKILDLDLSTEEAREKHAAWIFKTLQQLLTNIEQISQLANNYPANPTTADVWVTGAGYARIAHALTQHFKNAGWLIPEENASFLWARATLAVHSHYHHLVGPAMLANADCHERLGNSDRAAQWYGGVVKDFVFLLDKWSPETDAPIEEDRTAIECLRTATDRLISLGTRDIDTFNLMDIHAQIDTILNRPIPET